jgi:AraC-like DNA-binding protein
LAGKPKALIRSLPEYLTRPAAAEDVLSDVLKTVRLSGSVQFCVMVAGNWQTDAAPALGRMAKDSANSIPLHFVVEGKCWLRMDGRKTLLEAGDVVAFPFGTGHQLGAGAGGPLVKPVTDLPPRPWRQLPILKYGGDAERVRLLCGFLQCEAMRFPPLRNALPRLMHVRTAREPGAEFLRAALRQIVSEADAPRAGGLSVLERLTEIVFIEMLRHLMQASKPGSAGWLAALADPPVGRCLALIHEDPGREWSLQDLASSAGLSRSTLAQRFEEVTGTSPIRYIRDWRLCLAGMALTSGTKSIAAVAHEAGYGTEAAFNRAFSRNFGMPPAAWRQKARQGT